MNPCAISSRVVYFEALRSKIANVFCRLYSAHCVHTLASISAIKATVRSGRSAFRAGVCAMKWGTKAPSEKTLEDYISEHPECLGLCEIGPEEYAAEYQFTLRQVRLPSGIADLVGTTCSQREIVVAELKKGTINYSAVAQVLRYMSDLNATVGSLLSRLVLNGDPLSEFVPRNPAIEDDWKSIVRGVLIGAGVEDDNLVRICRSCNVLVYTYSWHENACSIREVGLKTKSHHSVLEACDEMSTRAIGKLLTSVVMNNLGDGQRENLGSFDAVSAANEYLSGINRGGEV